MILLSLKRVYLEIHQIFEEDFFSKFKPDSLRKFFKFKIFELLFSVPFITKFFPKVNFICFIG